MKVAVIGAGASGVMCALNIKELNSNIEVDLYEKEDRILKKLAATGGGRCNLGNSNIQTSCFNNESFIKYFMECYNVNSYLEYFNKYNLSIVEEKNLLYPTSKSASMVIDFFKYRLDKVEVNIICNKEIKRIDYKGSMIDNKHYDYIVISIGSSALYNQNVYSLVKQFKLTDLQQSLVGFKSNQIKDMKEVRQSAKVSLIRNGKNIISEVGEIQFKNDGLSGICIMNLSSKYELGDCISIDLFAEQTTNDIVDAIKNKDLTTKDCFNFTFDKKINNLIKIKDIKIDYLNDKELINFVNLYKNLVINIDGLYDYKFAQVVKGGIDLSEVNLFNSKKYPNVFFTGEILDIDGKCGGYNLWFAFNSGMKVGEDICKYVLEK